MTQARVLIAENSADRLREATAKLAGIHAQVLSTHNVRRFTAARGLRITRKVTEIASDMYGN